MTSCNKELILEFLEVQNLVSAREQAINSALVLLNPDNTILGIVPNEVDNLLWKLLTQIIGEDKADWLQWWLYEAEQKPSVTWKDGEKLPINNFEDLWENWLK
jgi:hypothetical protein